MTHRWMSSQHPTMLFRMHPACSSLLKNLKLNKAPVIKGSSLWETMQDPAAALGAFVSPPPPGEASVSPGGVGLKNNLELGGHEDGDKGRRGKAEGSCSPKSEL